MSARCVQASVAGTGQPKGRRGLTQRREGARLPRAPHSGDGGAAGRASAKERQELTLILKSPLAAVLNMDYLGYNQEG